MSDTHPTQPIIQVNDLRHVYLRGTPLEVTALNGVTMGIYEGESIGIIGRTGAGKSTIVQHLNGLIRPRQPDKVIIDGQDMSDPSMNVKAIRQKVGLVFQHPEQQLFERLVGDDIAFGPKKLGMPREERRERVRWAMEMVGLDFDKFKNRFTFSLSGGEMRKVAIAGILALQPKVLILDESTTGVDPRGRTELMARILDLRRKHGVTLIFVSPNMEEVASMVDRIYVIDDGRTVMGGTAREIFDRPDELRKYGLGVPQVTTVAHRLRERGLSIPRTPLTVAEAEEDIWKILNS
ncbi:MAG: ATP-binding cassette domain-containing protein [Anaerolineae bacterium]